MAASKIRLAVVGAGNQCTGSLMPGIPYIAELDLVAVCDLKKELAERNAKNFGAKAVYSDVHSMLRQEKPDGVIVVGPPQIHEDIGLQVLESGCHLFIEKPAAPTVAGAKRLVDAARNYKKIGQVGHMMRHADPVKVAWDISHAPDFGKILSVESKYVTWPTGAAGKDSGWGDSDENWTYMLVQGGHPIDLLRHFLGQVKHVAAFMQHGKGATKCYQVSVEGADGRVGFLNLQDSFNGWYTGLEIVGENQGIVRVDDLGKVTYRKGEKVTQSENSTWGNTAYTWEPHHTLTHWKRSGYGNQLRHFADCILNHKQPHPSLEDGWLNLVVAKAVLEACATKKVVEVPQA
jgi:phthalate 4,5-cis-dihydrodiol dehydrogenase